MTITTWTITDRDGNIVSDNSIADVDEYLKVNGGIFVLARLDSIKHLIIY